MRRIASPPQIFRSEPCEARQSYFRGEPCRHGQHNDRHHHAGRLGAEDLAAVALASASTGCIFMLLVGIVQGLSPICGHHFGARKFEQIGFEINQSLYLVLLLSIFGIGILSWTSFWTELGGVTGRIASLASLYLIASAVAVPAALLNRVFISVNAAINQPRITMWISLLMLALKAPVNALFMYGLFGLPELGAPVPVSAMQFSPGSALFSMPDTSSRALTISRCTQSAGSDRASTR